ncbi:hypothetical protein ES707_14987 [subsurface metagenome]
MKLGNKELYTIKELEKTLPLTRLTICEYLRKGKLKGHKIGRKWYVNKEDLEAFIDSGNQKVREEGEGKNKCKGLASV